MELRQLRYFVTVVDEGSFTRAAARLHLAQPGLSAQIRKLERELGQPLLDRAARTVTPTPVGHAVLDHARAALASAERVARTVDEFTGLLRGRVRLGAVSGVAGEGFDLAGVLAEFHAAHPGVTVELTEHASEHMLAALRHGGLDIALVGLTGAPIAEDLGVDVVLDTALVAAVALDSPLREALPVAALAEHRLISLPHGTGVRGVLDRACAAAGFAPEIAYEGAAPPLLLQLAAHGLGVAIVPGLTETEAARFGVRALAIVDPPLRGRLALVRHRDRPGNPAAAELLDRLRRAFGAPA
ncbi:LysR family transcriptional regulator [Nocardia takedensis]